LSAHRGGVEAWAIHPTRATARRSGALTLVPLPGQLFDRARQNGASVTFSTPGSVLSSRPSKPSTTEQEDGQRRVMYAAVLTFGSDGFPPVVGSYLTP